MSESTPTLCKFPREPEAKDWGPQETGQKEAASLPGPVVGPALAHLSLASWAWGGSL